MRRDSFSTIFGPETEFTGKLNFKGTVRIDGKFSGEIISDGRLIVGKGAHISGTIQIGELIVNSVVQADITASKIVILHKEAEVIGTLRTQRLEMEEGAMLQGQLDMGMATQAQQTALPLETLTSTDEAAHIKQ